MLLFLVCGCGMFVASSAFLPSSFSMYFTMLALGAWFMESNGVSVGREGEGGEVGREGGREVGRGGGRW